MPGILIPAFAGRTRAVQQQAAREDWNSMLSKFAAGPPPYSPLKAVDRFANVTEMFVHHEDVRRAAGPWEPRRLDDATEKALRVPLKAMGKRAIAKSPATVELIATNGDKVATGGRGPKVAVTGDPLELLLFAFGRKETRVEYTGDADAVAAVKAAKRGF
jgi:uncharacterized protein (TIGR03085 family)